MPTQSKRAIWISDCRFQSVNGLACAGLFFSAMNYNHIKKAIEFRQVFNQPFAEKRPTFTESDPLFEKLRMQLSLIQEEGNEFNEALEEWISASPVALLSEAEKLQCKHEVLKELADLVYVCYQMAAFLGLDLDQALDRVHQSNLSKLDRDGKAIYSVNGKVLKGPNYKKPDLTDLL